MKVSLIRTEQTERTNNKTRTRRLRVYAPWFARCVSLIDWFQEVTKHSAIKKKESQTNKQRQNKTTKNKRNELKGEMKRNEETNKHLEDHRTKKRTPKSTTNRTITRANGKLTHRETDEPTARSTNKNDRPNQRPTARPTCRATDRPTDRLNKRTTEGIVYWRNKQTKFPLTEPRSEIKNELQIQCTDKRTQRKTNKWTKASKISK